MDSGYAKSIVADRAGGTQAVGWAMKAIQQGHCTMCFAGGFEAPLVPYTYFIHESAGGVTCTVPDPEYRPFDRRRAGIILGEGAGVLLLEERGHALARGARIHAEVAGFSVTRDSLGRCLRAALADAHVPARDIGYYSPDAIATADADYREACALADVFEGGAHLSLSSSKPLTGHMLAAAGAVDAAMAAMVLEESVIPPMANVTDPDPSDLDLVTSVPRQRQVPAALCCSCGIGGLNAALVLTRHD